MKSLNLLQQASLFCKRFCMSHFAFEYNSHMRPKQFLVYIWLLIGKSPKLLLGREQYTEEYSKVNANELCQYSYAPWICIQQAPHLSVHSLWLLKFFLLHFLKFK